MERDGVWSVVRILGFGRNIDCTIIYADLRGG